MKARTMNLLTLAATAPARLRGVYEVLTQDPVAPVNVATALDRWAKKDPDRTFLLFERERITFGELARRVRRRARTLATSTSARPGVRRGDSVALMMSNHPQFLVNAWAIARLGAVVSLINTNLTGKGLSHAILQTRPRALIVGREHLTQARDALRDEPAARDLTWLWEETRSGHGLEDVSGALELPALDAEPAPEIEPVVTRGDDLYAYIFTSGTTGLPKASKISHARAFTAAAGFGRFTLGLSERDVLYVCLPLFHSSGFLIGAGSAVVTGATLALSRKLSVTRFWDEICDHGATAFVYIGEICRYLVGAPPHPRERAHRLTRVVGNGMRPDVWKTFVERFRPGIVHEFYGATEGNVNMTNLFGLEGSVGRMPPLPWLNNAFLAKFDPRGERHVRNGRGMCIECKAGEVGELLGRIDPTRVTTRFEGYLGDEPTDAKILRDVKEPGDAYFRSGDLLKRDWLGFYYFVDRIGDTFRWKGENVSTIEVGDVCGNHEGVQTANIYGVTVPGADGRAGMAALSLTAGGHFSPERFYEHVTKHLPPYAAPLFVRLLPEQEMTATFKLKKTELQSEGFDPAVVRDLLFYRDDRHKTFEVLDATAFERIRAGEIRL